MLCCCVVSQSVSQSVVIVCLSLFDWNLSLVSIAFAWALYSYIGWLRCVVVAGLLVGGLDMVGWLVGWSVGWLPTLATLTT